MTVSKMCLSLAILAVATVQFATPPQAHADTYSVVGIETDHGRFFYGMDDSGHVSFSVGGDIFHCGSVSPCYETLTYGANPIYSVSAPTYTWDFAANTTCFAIFPQTPCAVSYNGRTVNYSIEPDGLTRILSVSSGSNPPQVLFPYRTLTGPIVLDGTGDVLFDDGFGDIWYEAIDESTIPTPEPSSILLLATGLLALAITVRRHPLMQS
ncbi:MAG TPA: PEP-CTERM sorting domain-containing protein [Acidobacteriaceae bacterium]